MKPAAPGAPSADENQALASDPAASAWVSANAGTGKTEVLVRRILRLLLAGANPESILCLTYTKTAAAEMQNRLLDELARWATMASYDLAKRLTKVTGITSDQASMRRARRLFARTLEARGGLKIHTIHAFCERLLQRFPLEAGISPHFAVLDDRAQTDMKHAAFDSVVARAAEARDSALGQALTKIVALISEDYFRKVAGEMVEKRIEMSRMMAHHGARHDWTAREQAALKARLRVGDAIDGTLVAQMAGVLSDGAITAALAALSASAATSDDKRTEAALREAQSETGERRALALAKTFLTKNGEMRSRIFGSKFETAQPEIALSLSTAQEQFAKFDVLRAHLRLAEANGALIALADAIRTEYEERKQAEAVLDYDDLIERAQLLLGSSGAAAWVLYKIDGGIDHILVDEAQDTNPAQWTIIAKLAEEFFAGLGAREKTRTLFAVGDEKQSIYSFQGADPKKFGETGRTFKVRVKASGQDWHDVPLNVSFRSTAPILTAVDGVFASPLARPGVVADGAMLSHYPHREHDAGLVELWEVESDKDSEEAEAFEPWREERSGTRSVDDLCARIAGLIKHWLDSGTILPSAGRPIRPGDVLILVRRREPFTTPMFRALKRLEVPVAGADRMRLMEQLAVQDLVALAEMLSMPEDDLSLAVVLKSPLFGLTDDDLFKIGYGRRHSLWAALKSEAAEDERFAEADATLSAWLSRIDFQPPYEFFSELLERDGQRLRKRFLARLGPEAAEAIDEFLDRALAYDREEAPSLQGFTDWLRVSDVEIKRDMDQDRDEVRIMTVHGAKGLQAPIVFLPDTCTAAKLQNPIFYPVRRDGVAPDEVTHLVWAPKGHSKLEALAESKAVLNDANREEHHRLLYVGMTRPCDRLYIAGWQGKKKRDDGSWYHLIEDSLKARLDRADGHDGRPVWRHESEQKVPVEPKAAPARVLDTAEPPRWATAPAAEERPRFVLMPSRIGTPPPGESANLPEQPPLGPQELAGNSRFSRGRLIHTLLQYLPDVEPEEREQAARSFVALRGAELPAEMREEIVKESLAIVREPDFASLFGRGSLGEVPVVARFGKGASAKDLSGQIDRLVVTEDEVFILDYKTNRPPPAEPKDVAEGYIAQLAAYRLALRAMFPGRNLRAAIVWTDGPRLMEIPSTLLDDAERRIRDAGSMP